MAKSLDFKFLADEGFSFSITSILKKKGFNIKWVGDISPGISDMAVYNIAQNEDRIILTEDKDFGELAVRFKLKIRGVVILRISSKEKELRNERVVELLERFPEKLEGHLIIVDSQKFRFREL